MGASMKNRSTTDGACANFSKAVVILGFLNNNISQLLG